MKPEELIGCCGIHCGTCARWHEYTVFRDAAALLAEIADGHGFQHWMPDDVKEFNYTEFRKGLDFFAGKDGWLVCRAPCRANEGMAACRFRRCCKDHGVELCFACSEYPCDHISGNGIFARSAEEYRRLGKNRWLKQMVERAKQGYELHTGKCYQVEAEVCPAKDRA